MPSMPNKSRHMFVITDETPLIELLSSAKVPGRLYSMIASIVSLFLVSGPIATSIFVYDQQNTILKVPHDYYYNKLCCCLLYDVPGGI